MTDRFFENLPYRIRHAHPDPAWEEFSVYVRVVRLLSDMDREELAQRAEIEKTFLSNLENGLLLPDEQTEEVWRKIEDALPIPYHEFQRLPRDIIAELKRDWGYSSSGGQGDIAISLSWPVITSYQLAANGRYRVMREEGREVQGVEQF